MSLSDIDDISKLLAKCGCTSDQFGSNVVAFVYPLMRQKLNEDIFLGDRDFKTMDIILKSICEELTLFLSKGHTPIDSDHKYEYDCALETILSLCMTIDDQVLESRLKEWAPDYLVETLDEFEKLIVGLEEIDPENFSRKIFHDEIARYESMSREEQNEYMDELMEGIDELKNKYL